MALSACGMTAGGQGRRGAFGVGSLKLRKTLFGHVAQFEVLALDVHYCVLSYFRINQA